MDSLIVDATNLTPGVDFKNTGTLLLEGKSCPIDVNKFYAPILKWIDSLKAKHVTFNINLEYINSASIKKIFLLLKHLDLRRPIFYKTASYGHFGRNEPDFTWEKTDKADLLRKEAGLKK